MRRPFFLFLVLSLLSCSPGEGKKEETSSPPEAGKLPASQSVEEAALTSEELRQKVHKDIERLTEMLTQEGKYHCCIARPCRWCAFLAGGCNCFENMKKGVPVCDECAHGWRGGLGIVPGIKPEDVDSFLMRDLREQMKTKHH